MSVCGPSGLSEGLTRGCLTVRDFQRRPEARRVGRKRYVVAKRGFLQRVGGWRVGRGAVVVPERAVAEFDALLRSFGVSRSMVPVWVQRP